LCTSSTKVITGSLYSMKNHKAIIKGLTVTVSSVPAQMGKAKRETDIFIFWFNSLHSANSKSCMIIEWKNGKWAYNENSPVRNNPDLMEAAGMYIDKYYAKMERRNNGVVEDSHYSYNIFRHGLEGAINIIEDGK